MRFIQWLQEQTTTAKGGGALGADAVTSNKMLTVRLSDDRIKKAIKELKSRNNVEVDSDGTTAKLELPYDVPKKLMNILKKYREG